MKQELENLYGFLRFAVEKHPFLLIFSILFAGMVYLTNSFIQSPDGAFSAYILGNKSQTEVEVQELREELELLRAEVKNLLEERNANTQEWNTQMKKLESIKQQHYSTKAMLEDYKEKMEKVEHQLHEKETQTESTSKP